MSENKGTVRTYGTSTGTPTIIFDGGLMTERDSSKSFISDVKPLFRESDRTSMFKAFDLWDYDDVVTHQEAIMERLADGSMPCDGPWPAGDVDLFRSWMSDGSQP